MLLFLQDNQYHPCILIFLSFEVFFEEAGDFGAVLKGDVNDADSEDSKDGEAGDESGLFAGGGGDKRVGGAIVVSDFAAAAGLGIALVALFAGGENTVLFDRFTAASQGIAIFASRTLFNLGYGSSFDTIPCFFIDDFALWASAVLLVIICFARSRAKGD